MRFHLEDFWPKSPFSICVSAKVPWKAHGDWKEYNFVHHGKQLGWQAPALIFWFCFFVSIDLLRFGFFEAGFHRTSPVAPDAGVAKSTWTCKTSVKAGHLSEMPCPDISLKPPVSFVPESSLNNHLGHLWSTNGHTQGMTSDTKLHEFWDHFGILWSLRKRGLPVLQYSIQWYSKYPHAENVHWKSLILWNPLQVGCFQHSPQVGSEDSPWKTWKIVDSPSFPARDRKSVV